MSEPVDPTLEARIDDDPDDDHGYAAYATWLLAQGSPRGELATVQLARAREDTPALAAREAALMKEHAARFRGMHESRHTRWLDDFCVVRWHGGFWRYVAFDGNAVDLRLVLAHRSSRFVRTLHVRSIDDYSEVYDAAITAVAEAGPGLGALRELRIGDMPEGQTALVGFGDRTCTKLAALARARLPQLEQLDLAFDANPESDALWDSLCWPDDALDELLAALPVAMPRLQRLRVWPMPYEPEHPLLARLAGTPRLQLGNWEEPPDDADGTYEL